MKRRILIVDDDHDVTAILRDRLSACGYDTLVAHHGCAALELMSQYETTDDPIVGVLLDVMMPVLDGLATVQEIQSRYPTIPVLMMSGCSDSHIKDEALRKGAREFLIKPVSVDTLVACCRRFFGGSTVPSS
ncbi:response regulator [Nitrospira sp. Nam74]